MSEQAPPKNNDLIATIKPSKTTLDGKLLFFNAKCFNNSDIISLNY